MVLIRRTVLPREYASSFDSPAALLDKLFERSRVNKRFPTPLLSSQKVRQLRSQFIKILNVPMNERCPTPFVLFLQVKPRHGGKRTRQTRLYYLQFPELLNEIRFFEEQ